MARTPRLVFKGNDRARLRNLQKAIDMVLGMDSRAQNVAAEKNFEPVLFVSSNSISAGLQRTLDRISLCLSLKG